MLLNTMAQDMEADEGLVLIDPHGDLFDAAYRVVPERRRGDLVLAHAEPLGQSCNLGRKATRRPATGEKGHNEGSR
jgi:hypothetical protein